MLAGKLRKSAMSRDKPAHTKHLCSGRPDLHVSSSQTVPGSTSPAGLFIACGIEQNRAREPGQMIMSLVGSTLLHRLGPVLLAEERDGRVTE